MKFEKLARSLMKSASANGEDPQGKPSMRVMPKSAYYYAPSLAVPNGPSSCGASYTRRHLFWAWWILVHL